MEQENVWAGSHRSYGVDSSFIFPISKGFPEPTFREVWTAEFTPVFSIDASRQLTSKLKYMEEFFKLSNRLIRINRQSNDLESSTDGGHFWQYLKAMNSIESETGSIHEMLVFKDELLALADRGLYKSTDGYYWQFIQGLQSITSVTGDIRSITANDNEFLIVGRNGLFFSKDGHRWDFRSR